MLLVHYSMMRKIQLLVWISWESFFLRGGSDKSSYTIMHAHMWPRPQALLYFNDLVGPGAQLLASVGVSIETPHGQVVAWCKYFSSDPEDKIAS